MSDDSLPVTTEEWAATPRPVPLEPDETDLRIASTICLLPCPFCGNRSVIAHGAKNEQTRIFGYRVECADHRCFGSVFSNSRDRDEARTRAIEKWQTRANVPTSLALHDVEQWAIAEAMRQNPGKHGKVKAAEQLGVSLKTLYNKLNDAATVAAQPQGEPKPCNPT